MRLHRHLIQSCGRGIASLALLVLLLALLWRGQPGGPQESFTSFDRCVSQGYPFGFCAAAPGESDLWRARARRPGPSPSMPATDAAPVQFGYNGARYRRPPKR